MRILFISSLYPPYVMGGWEQLVQEINEHLSARGHLTHVLTSTHGVSQSSIQGPGISRVLRLESDPEHYHPVESFLRRRRRLQHNLACTRDVIDEFAPDVIFVHLMWNLSRGVPWLAEQLRPGRVVYYMAGAWPCFQDVHTTYWQQPALRRSRRLPKLLVAGLALRICARDARSFPLQFQHVLCVSHAVKDALAGCAGIAPESMRVVYNGIDADRFKPRQLVGEGAHDRDSLTLLYAGSVVPHKGVRTAVEAMACLRRMGELDGITLTIVGSGHPDYEASLRRLVASEQLGTSVRFQDRIPRDAMPDLLSQFDVLVFPSVWDEPLARAVQEAMAVGLVVVGTTTGGMKEILVEGETGLTFEAEDANGLARQLVRLRRDRELRLRLLQNARAKVLRDFTIGRMIMELEQALRQAAQTASQELVSHSQSTQRGTGAGAK